MKKMLSLFLAAALGISMLTGCSAKPAETAAPTTAAQTAAATEATTTAAPETAATEAAPAAQ